MTSPEGFRPIKPNDYVIRYGPIRFKAGEKLLERSVLDPEDSLTIQGFTLLDQALEEGGAVLAEGHRLYTDSFGVGARFLHTVENLENILVPITIQHSRSPWFKPALDALRRTPGFDLVEVVREKDYKKALKLGIKKVEIVSLNREFRKKTGEYLSQPRHLVYVAAYGSRKAFGTNIFRGMEKICRQAPVLCTLAKRVGRIRYVVYA